jgi:lactoylglutathione lyase
MSTNDLASTGHVGLNVSDLARSLAFYTDVFGWQVLQESADETRRFAFLAREGRLVLTLWQQSEGRFETRRPGLHHLAFEVPGIEAVRLAERRLRELGVRFHHDGVVPHAEGAASGGIFFEDPDGIRLEIYSATGAEHAAAATPGAPACGFF